MGAVVSAFILIFRFWQRLVIGCVDGGNTARSSKQYHALCRAGTGGYSRGDGMTSNQEVLTTGDSDTIALEKYLVDHHKEGSYLVVSGAPTMWRSSLSIPVGSPWLMAASSGRMGAITLDELKEQRKENHLYSGRC